MSLDCLSNLFDELRRDLPSLPVLISDSDSRTTWLKAVGQVIAAMPPERQIACTILISQDLSYKRYPSLPWTMIYAWLCGQFEIVPVQMEEER